jgi:NADPH:quinone reductase-like Zn-dependent oxidoreductase
VTPTNQAAWLSSRPGRLAVGPAPYTAPGPRQIVVRNRAVAVNQIDWLIEVTRGPLFPWLKGARVLGTDVAGEAVEVGAEVSRFKAGDRVFGLARGTDKGHAPAEGAFQLYTLLDERTAAPIPAALDFAQAAVLPLGVSTAASGLFQQDGMRLRHPTAQPPEPTGQSVLVWSGASSVGSSAIQLAVAADYDVVTTCSPRNADYVAGLGARRSFDYHRPDVVDDLAADLAGRQVAGAIALGDGSARPCLEVLERCQGERFLAQAAGSVSMAPLADHPGRFPLMLAQFAGAAARTQLSAMAKRVKTKFIWGSSLADNEVGPMIYEQFLPAAMADGRFCAAPQPQVVGSSLDDLQHALDVQRAGVSARKVVVTLGA